MQNTGDNLNVHMMEGDLFNKVCYSHTVEFYEAMEESNKKKTSMNWYQVISKLYC